MEFNLCALGRSCFTRHGDSQRATCQSSGEVFLKRTGLATSLGGPPSVVFTNASITDAETEP
eukprot:1097501-Prymnesium_polylepis.1